MLNPDKRPLMLQQEVTTRWNARFTMFQRLKDLRQPLAVVLSQLNMPDNLSQYEWNKIEEYVNVFSSLKETTLLMEGDKYPSSSLYLSIVLGFEQILSGEETSSFEEKDLYEKVSAALFHRFSFAHTNETLIISMFVDPRYKNRFSLNDPQK